MKRPLALIAVVLFVSGIVFEAKHRAATLKNHIPPVESAYPDMEAQYLITNSDFAGHVDLWGAPMVKTPQVNYNYGSQAFKDNLTPANFEKLQATVNYKTEPVLTVLDREIAVALFSIGDFNMTLNLKPAYANPDAIMPSHIDAGIGGSFSF